MATSTTESVLALFAWLSPSYPGGAFAYSHGLEWAIETGDVRDAQTLACWIESILEFGSDRNDAILFAAARRTRYDCHIYREERRLEVTRQLRRG